MNISLIIRVLALPIGLLIKLFGLALVGSRDINNKFRFKGATIDSGCCINSNSKIASNTHLLDNCIINNSTINMYSYIGKNSIVQNTNIGKFCSIANDVLIGLGKHPIEYFSTSPLFYRKNNPLNLKFVEKDFEFNEYEPVSIGNDVWIGARAIILDGITIEHGAIIAAGSVITKNVPAYAIVGGIPARIIKYRFSEETIKKNIETEWWNWDIEKILHNFTD